MGGGRIAYATRIPVKLKSKYWPCKTATIPQAARWFRDTHGTPPEMIVCPSRDLSVIQDIWLWSGKAPSSSQLHFRETYGLAAGDVKYHEAVRLAVLQVEQENRKKHVKRRKN